MNTRVVRTLLLAKPIEIVKAKVSREPVILVRQANLAKPAEILKTPAKSSGTGLTRDGQVCGAS